ncbi:MAG: hypothetical protein HFH14_06065 [Lachnospiraceae bacterium]|nr:hypothetical protein [Lachnospiraceae bacterium]
MKGVRNNFIVKLVLLIVVLAVGVLGLYYTVINNKSDEAMDDDYPKTTYEILVSRDFENRYPATPYEVLKLYNKYLKYIYNTESSDKEIETLVDCIRSMWSKDWLALNERGAHIENMKKEIEEFRKDKRVMSNYTVSDSATIRRFSTHDNVEGCTLMSSYLYTQKKKTSKAYMMFYFLKEDGKWKILYYELTDESGNKIS